MKRNWATVPVMVLAALCYLYTGATAQDCASTTGASNAGTFTTATLSGSSVVWSNPANAQSSDGNYAMATIPIGFFSSAFSNYLVIKNFGFSIPLTGHICSIVVTISHKAGGTNFAGNVADKSVHLLQNNLITGNDLAVTSSHWSTTEATVTYGDGLLTDTWGGSWEPADVNSANFGVAIATSLNSGIGSIQALINQVTVTIVYDANSLLGITLGKFTAGPDGEGNLLNWTASASTGDKFIVQRSGDSRSWENMATIPATTAPIEGPSRTYSFTDQNPLDGANFYRLQMVNIDGKTTWSNTSEVINKTNNRIHCWPNPFIQTLYISSPTAVNKVILRDVQGRVLKIRQASPAAKDWEIPADGLPPGLYFIQVGSQTLRVLKDHP